MSFGREVQKITGETVKNTDFFPNIDLGDFQEQMRIDSEYRIEVIKRRVRLAIVYVNKELKEQQTVWTEEGHATLKEVPAEPVDDESPLVFEYLNAVYSHAKATLMQDYKTMNRREEAENEAKDSSSTFDSYLADCRDSIKALSNETQGSLEIYEV